VQAAKLQVVFIVAGPGGQTIYATFGGATGWELLDGATKLKGTGSKQGTNPLNEGSIFLQSHWGSLVEFKNPNIQNIS
jgi:hypothetical protein